MLEKLKKDLKKLRNSEKANILQRFFKTGPGQYGEADIFLGVMVPQTRVIAQKYKNLLLKEIEELLCSKIHEERLAALLILVHKYNNSQNKKEIFDFYVNNVSRINNWDLVDLTAPKIMGNWLLNKPKKILYRLAKSDKLWEKRISIISTFAFIKEKQFDDALAISEILINDKHDLIHKAVGWMLREIGKKDEFILENFLRKNYKNMPRTMLRYAIERFNEDKRKAYLKGEI